MRLRILLISFILCAFPAISGVEMVSFYFEEDNTKPTGYTTCKLDELRQLMSTHHVQVIEINAFSDIIGSVEENKHLATNRLNFILTFLELDREGIETKVHGKSKVPVNFRPFTWHRVDVYYFLGEAYELPEEVVEEMTADVQTSEQLEEVPAKQVPEIEQITENVPVVLGIEFKGGTNSIKKGSQPRLEQLYNTLEKYPELTVHIRGHVCCGNNKRISRKRAKVVYKYLKEKGIGKERLSFKGYSNYLPLVFPERTAEDRATNRRVDVIFSKLHK